MAKLNTYMALTSFAILLFAGAFVYMAMNGGFKAQVVQTGGKAQITTPQGYTPFPLGTLKIYLKDKNNPTTAVSTATVDGKVFSVSTPDSALPSPTTPYLDSADISSGALSFTAKKIQTATGYKVKIWDNTGSPTWYPVEVKVSVPALDPNLGASAQYTAPDVYMEKIGTFADPMQSEATGAGGGSLPTGVTSAAASNAITINITAATDSTITIRIPLTFADTATGTYLRDVVLVPIQDPSNPMPTTAFTAATLTYVSGTNFNVPGNILNYVSGQLPIKLGDWTDSTSGTYYLQISLDKASLSSGDKFYFRLDDQGGYLSTDSIAGQSGASGVNFYITVVS